MNKRGLVVGIDLDNTLISYDSLFHRLALEQKLIGADIPADKSSVRDYLRRIGREPDWTALQGLAYGPRLSEAEPFAGAMDFLREGLRRDWEMHIVSHKTKQPIVGDPYDLHAAARGWLDTNSVHDVIGFPRAHVWFELTKKEKIARIRALGCQVFIDDLPELLLDPDFPAGVRRIFFAPPGSSLKDMPADFHIARSWAEILPLISDER